MYNKTLLPASFNKNRLYIPMREERIIKNFNGRIPFPSSRNTFLCRHSAAHIITAIVKNGMMKIDWNLYCSKKSIIGMMPGTIEADYKALKANPTRVDLISNDRFGGHLVECFEDMQRLGKNEPVRAGLIESTNHTMVIRLRKDGVPVFF